MRTTTLIDLPLINLQIPLRIPKQMLLDLQQTEQRAPFEALHQTLRDQQTKPDLQHQIKQDLLLQLQREINQRLHQTLRIQVLPVLREIDKRGIILSRGSSRLLF